MPTGLLNLFAARAIDGNNNNLAYKEAVIHALAGRRSEALQKLQEAFQKHYSPAEAKSDPELNSLHGGTEFEKLLREF